MTLDYTWQAARGNSSDPRETATRAEAGEDPRPRRIPLNWDQRHTLNVSANLSRPETSPCGDLPRRQRPAVHAESRAGSAPATRQTPAGSPPASSLDLRGEKAVRLGGCPIRAVRPRLQCVRHPLLQRRRVRHDREPVLLPLPDAEQCALSNPTPVLLAATHRGRPDLADRGGRARRERAPSLRRRRRSLRRRRRAALRAGARPVITPVPPEQRGRADAERQGTHDAARIRTVLLELRHGRRLSGRPGRTSTSPCSTRSRCRRAAA